MDHVYLLDNSRSLLSVKGDTSEYTRYLKARPKGYFHMKRYKEGLWDGWIRLYQALPVKAGYHRILFPTGLVPRLLDAFPDRLEVKDVRPEDIRYDGPSLDVSLDGLALWDFQQDLVGEFKAFPLHRGFIKSPTGSGKCLGRGTPVLMFDGSVKPVEEIVEGDLLMGPDSLPRRVSSVTSGVGKLYRITPIKGDSWICNGAHVLSLRRTGTDRIVNISLIEYLYQSKTFKHTHKLWRTGVEFPIRPVKIDPYFLGLWLGDGRRSSLTICTMDPEVVSAIEDVVSLYPNLHVWKEVDRRGNKAASYHIVRRDRNGGSSNTLLDAFRSYGLISRDPAWEKFIPDDYLVNSSSVRRQLLAGIIDADGFTKGGYCDLVNQYRKLSEQIVFLARSLGFAAYLREKVVLGKTYYRVSICGDLSSLPLRVERRKCSPRKQKKNVLNTGFTVEDAGVGEYFGFTLEGPDRLFLLGDFTVTHNTEIAAALIAHYAVPTLFLVGTKALLHQTAKRLASRFGMDQDQIGMLGDSIKNFQPITVATVQTVNRLLKVPAAKPFWDSIRFLIFDEVHHAVSTTWYEVALALKRAPVRLGLSATPVDPDDRLKTLRLEAATGPLISATSMTELAERGYVAAPKVFVFTYPAEEDLNYLKGSKGWGIIRKRLVEESPVRLSIIGDLLRASRETGNQVLILVDTIRHAKILARTFPGEVVMAHGKHTSRFREQVLDDFRQKKITALVATTWAEEGVDLPDVRVVIISGGKSYRKVLQSIGRGSRKKSEGDATSFAVIDFNTVGNRILQGHWRRREKFYELEGFEVLDGEEIYAYLRRQQY